MAAPVREWVDSAYADGDLQSDWPGENEPEPEGTQRTVERDEEWRPAPVTVPGGTGPLLTWTLIAVGLVIIGLAARAVLGRRRVVRPTPAPQPIPVTPAPLPVDADNLLARVLVALYAAAGRPLPRARTNREVLADLQLPPEARAHLAFLIAEAERVRFALEPATTDDVAAWHHAAVALGVPR